MKKKDSMVNVEQGSFRDGFISSFSMILLAEIADKTFFIACIMAMRYRLVQGWAVVPGFDGIPVPVPQIPGIGTGTGTQSRGTVGTGTKICGTVPLLKSRGTTNPGISGQESRSVPGWSRCPGILRDANPAWFREAIYFSIKNSVWTVNIGPSIYIQVGSDLSQKWSNRLF